MLKKKAGLFSVAFIYIFGSFFTQGLRFLTLPIFSRIMSTSDFGFLAAYETWVAIITVIIGMQTISSIANAYIDFGEINIADYVYSITYVASLTALICTSILCIFAGAFSSLLEVSFFSLLLGIVQCLFTFFFTSLVNEYRMLNKPWKYLVFTVGNSIVNVILAIVFVAILPNDKYIGRVYALTIAAFLFGIIAIVVIICNTSNKKPKIEYVKYALRLSIPLIFHAFAAIILSRCDQIMILKYISPSEAGVYSYGTNFAHIIYVLYTACNQAYIPWYYKKLEQKKKQDIIFMNKSYIILFSLGFSAFIFILPEIIKIMSDQAYYGAMYSAPIVALGFFLNFLYNFPVNYEFFHKKTHFIAIGTVCAACMNLVFNMILIPVFGAVGAAIATAGAYFVLLIAHIFVAKKIVKNYSMPVRYFAISIVGVFFAVLLYYITIKMVLVRWLVFGICVLFTLIFCFKIKDKIRTNY